MVEFIGTISDSTDEWCDKFQIHSITNLDREFHELLSNYIINDKSLSLHNCINVIPRLLKVGNIYSYISITLYMIILWREKIEEKIKNTQLRYA